MHSDINKITEIYVKGPTANAAHYILLSTNVDTKEPQHSPGHAYPLY